MEELIFQTLSGYYDGGDIINAPDNCLISNSYNVIFTKVGIPVSIKEATLIGNDNNEGGSKAFVLDDGIVGLLGNNDSTEKAIGNILQGSNKNLWFVGNTISNGVRVWEDFTSFLQIGGTRQIETVAVTAGCTVNGNLTVRVTGAYLTGSPIDVTVAVNTTDHATTADVALKVQEDLRANSVINAAYYIRVDTNTSTVELIDRTVRANDGTLAITLQNAGGTGVTFGASTNDTAGAIDTQANLSTVPQIAKYNGTGWDEPVQVGLAPQEDAPILELTTNSTMGVGFQGKITGSISARIARMRNGTVSIASGLSNVVTGAGNSVYAYIPSYAEDGSDLEDRVWFLYFTVFGRGSQSAHRLFPIELPEKYLNGLEENGYTETIGKNCRLTVVSQHETDQTQRKVEIEFLSNDLLLIEPFEDYYPAESSKFIAKIGNVMCLIGTGTNQTGFDVSYPNNREAYPPDWRDWFREVPVAMTNSEFGFLWISTSYNTYQALWTGATQESAPVVLREVSNRYGAIGENATISINGVLYMLSKGKIPVRIDPDGNLDDKFGDVVTNHFSSYTDKTVLGYDEKTNTVFYFNEDSNFIGYQIDTGKWTTPVTVGYIYEVDSAFTLDGSMYYCFYNDLDTSYQTAKFNDGTVSSPSWRLVTGYKTGKFGFNLKDIVEVRLLVKSEVIDNITVTGLKNFDSTLSDSLFTVATVAKSQVTVRKLVESIDYESISLKMEGSKYGQSPYSIMVVIDNHAIERAK